MSQLPETLDTDRLRLRVPRLEDAPAVNAAIIESLADLRPWMPWAKTAPSLEDSAAFCHRSRAEWTAGTALSMLIWRSADGAFLGSIGYPRLDWAAPRFEIGYWLRSSALNCGYATEATAALTRYAFQTSAATRVDLWIDERNERSRRVAQRLGFERESVLHAWTRDTDGVLADMGVYRLLRLTGLRPPATTTPDAPTRPRKH